MQDGVLRTILGNPDTATLRAGYSMTYNAERFDRFTGSVGSNPGGTISANRNATTGFCLVCPGESWLLLFSQTSRLGAPAFPEAPVYPLAATTAQSIQIFQPELRTPRVHSYSVGFQRALGDDAAIEVRYVGNKSLYTWGEETWNERTIFENEFVDEFRLGQANLEANLSAGKGATFAYTGVPGTSPLPIHQAYLSGRSGADVTNPARYTASQYANSAFLARLSGINPDVPDAATAIDTTAFRANALAAGLPANFFVLNPKAGGAQVVTDRGGSRYTSLQVELRRHLSKGLLASASYTYGISKTLSNETLRLDRFEVDDTRVPHEFKAQWTYELPIGRGRRFGTDLHPVVNGLIGNWEFSGSARVQSQRYRITNAKLVGDAPDINLNGPLFTRVDMRVKKSFPFLSRGNVELTFELLNAFNNINFNHALNPGSGAAIFQVTSAYTDINTTFDPGGRIGQIVWRINW